MFSKPFVDYLQTTIKCTGQANFTYRLLTALCEETASSLFSAAPADAFLELVCQYGQDHPAI